MGKEETQKTTLSTHTYGEQMKITDKNIAKLDSESIGKKPAANSLSKQRIEKLFRMFCFNCLCPRDEVDFNRLKWKDCSGCLLREIPWERKKGQVEDLCYAIWYEGILKDA